MGLLSVENDVRLVPRTPDMPSLFWTQMGRSVSSSMDYKLRPHVRRPDDLKPSHNLSPMSQNEFESIVVISYVTLMSNCLELGHHLCQHRLYQLSTCLSRLAASIPRGESKSTHKVPLAGDCRRQPARVESLWSRSG